MARFFPYIDSHLMSLHSSYALEQIPIKFSQQLNNVYGPAVRGDLAYISDSTGRWRYGHPLDSNAFRARKPIQLLIHPIWWIQEGETVTQKLEDWLYRDYLNSRSALRDFLPKLFKLSES
jgi:hypothetical protein